MSSKRKYRSSFEEGVGTVLEEEGFLYEPYKVPYWIPANYTPDFVYEGGWSGTILVECKGYFRPGDQKKYKAIRDELPYDMELVFILQKPHQKVNKKTKMTMAEWCEKEGLEWFDSPEDLLEALKCR